MAGAATESTSQAAEAWTSLEQRGGGNRPRSTLRTGPRKLGGKAGKTVQILARKFGQQVESMASERCLNQSFLCLESVMFP